MSLESDGDLDVLMSLLGENDSESINESQKGVPVVESSHIKQPAPNINDNESLTVDPLEKELLLMEEKMKKLREEILKKKNIKSIDKNGIGFTKPSLIINPGCSSLEGSTRYLDADEKEKLFKELASKKSEIHSGDTDSEDDEDNRTPLEAQLTSYGKEMKKRIAHSKHEHKPSYNPKNPDLNGWKEARGGSLLAVGKNNSTKSNVKDTTKSEVDPFSGIKVINPLVSVDTMKSLMDDRRMIQMSTISSHLRGGEIEGDWVTIGVIVSKSETKTSQKGTQYSIWQMSDLRDCTKVASLFLFAGAYKNLWKTVVGSVIGVLNPQIMQESNKPNDGRNCITLSINTHEKVLLMGVSKDLGWCKGRTKQGTSCRQFVNKNVCEFCVFHIQREYQKMSSKRAEIQSSFGRVEPRKSFQNRVLGKNQVFYGGQLYGSNNEKKASQKSLSPAFRAKDLATLSSLSTKLKAESLKEKDKKESFILNRLTDEQITAVKTMSKDNEELGQMLLAPSPGARNLLLHKTKSSFLESDPSCNGLSHQPQKLSAKEFLSSTISCANSKFSGVKPPPTPLLGRGLAPGKDLEIEFSPKFNTAKAKAASILQRKGGVLPTKKNMKRNKDRAASADFQKNVRKRIREVSDPGEDDESSSVGKKPKDAVLPGSEMQVSHSKSLLGSIDINSDQFRSMMKAKSSHTNLIQAAEDEEVEKYYNSLEKKEMLENKMASTTEVPCKAVICLQCKYKALSAADLCREEKHPLKIMDATKRFFECRNCKQRTISLNKLPTKSCSHCSHSSWKRVAMARDKKGPTLESEVLSLRGDELAQIYSNSNKVFINL